jgi:hypothetical protein
MAGLLIPFPKRKDFACMNYHRVKGPDALAVCEFCDQSLCAFDLGCRCTCSRSKSAPPREVRLTPPSRYPKQPLILAPAAGPDDRRRRDA